jgi:pyrroline-5-carboxylate reductase
MTSSATLNRLAIIGGGKMGTALLAGFLKANLVAPENTFVVEPYAPRRAELETLYPGIVLCADVDELNLGAQDAVVVAVHPESVPAVLDSLSAHIDQTLIVSIALGITVEMLEAHLPSGTPVVRVMPNLPATVGEAMSLLTPGSAATEAQTALAVRLLESVGRAQVIPEDLQPAVGAVSGSGPAYFALVVDALARAGVKHGLTHALATELAVQTMLGTARLLQETGQGAEALMDAVSSPGGSTIRAVAELEHGGIRSAFFYAVDAAVERTLGA